MLLSQLDDHDETVRSIALINLSDRLEPPMIPKLQSLLDDADPSVRSRAADYISELNGRAKT